MAILLYLYPIFVAILSILFLNEISTKNKFFALFLAISGTILVIGFNTSGNIKGIMLGIGAALIYSVYTIVGARLMKQNDIFTSTLVVIGSAACVYFLYNIKSGFFFPKTISFWMNTMAIAIISTAAAIYTYFHGMRLSGAVNAAMLSTFEPVTTMVLASVFLGQHIGWLQITGTALILTSAVLVAANSKAVH